MMLMQADEARVRIVNNTYTSDLGERTAGFLGEQGVNVVEQGVPTGAASQPVLIVYTPKLYALRFLIERFEVTGSNQVVIQPDPAETVDIEIRLGEDWVGNCRLDNEVATGIKVGVHSTLRVQAKFDTKSLFFMKS